MKLFSIRDAKAEAFTRPFFANTTGEALRSFTSAVNQVDEKNVFFTNTEDFDLYLCAEFDERTGKIKSPDTPQHLSKGVEVKKVQNLT